MPEKLPDHLEHLESFQMIHGMIQKTRQEAYHQVNKVLIGLYWSIGRYVSEKVGSSAWGENVVDELSRYLISKEPGMKGFSARNIWRMKKFYELYKEDDKLSALLTEISWSNHLHILSKTKQQQERQFYLELAAKHHYSARAFSRIIDSGTFERSVLANQKLSTVLAEFPADTQKKRMKIQALDYLFAKQEMMKL